MTYHLTPTRVATVILKKTEITGVSKDETLEPLCINDANIKWHSLYGKSMAVPQKTKNRIITQSLEEIFAHLRSLVITAKSQDQHKYPPPDKWMTKA